MIMRALAMAFLMMLAGAAASYAANGYDVPVGATVTIDEHGECREVTNPAGQPGTRFVSTRTAPEWQSFRDNPNDLIMAVCSGGDCAPDIWTARESNRTWRAVASSANGAKLVAAENGGRIMADRFTLRPTAESHGRRERAIEAGYGGLVSGRHQARCNGG